MLIFQFLITGNDDILNLEPPIGTSSINSSTSFESTGLSINSPTKPVSSSIFHSGIFLARALINIGAELFLKGVFTAFGLM